VGKQEEGPTHGQGFVTITNHNETEFALEQRKDGTISQLPSLIEANSRTWVLSTPHKRIRRLQILLENFDFKENSRKMFDEVCNITPWLFRHFTRNGLIKGLQDEGCGNVTENIMYAVCKKVAPEKHLKQTLDVLNKYKTISP